MKTLFITIILISSFLGVFGQGFSVDPEYRGPTPGAASPDMPLRTRFVVNNYVGIYSNHNYIKKDKKVLRTLTRQDINKVAVYFFSNSFFVVDSLLGSYGFVRDKNSRSDIILYLREDRMVFTLSKSDNNWFYCSLELPSEKHYDRIIKTGYFQFVDETFPNGEPFKIAVNNKLGIVEFVRKGNGTTERGVMMSLNN